MYITIKKNLLKMLFVPDITGKLNICPKTNYILNIIGKYYFPLLIRKFRYIKEGKYMQVLDPKRSRTHTQ